MTIQETILKRLASREPVSRYALRTYLANKGFVISDREMRREIVRLRKKEGYLITSSLKGYKLCQGVKEFEHHIEFKRKYALSILAECRDMKRNFKRHTKPQFYAI